jgi:RNA polymerase primary sigma factor
MPRKTIEQPTGVMEREFDEADNVSGGDGELVFAQAFLGEEFDEAEPQLKDLKEVDLLSDDEIYDALHNQGQDGEEFDNPTQIHRQYMREIEKFPLLELEQEKAVTRKVWKGLQAEKILASGKVIGKGERKALEQDRSDLEENMELLARSNLRLVVSIAKRYYSKHLTLLDLIGEGNIGLCKAMHGFEPERGFKFSTYATHWIRQGIRRSFINSGHDIRIPVHMYEKLEDLVRVRKDLLVELKRNPTENELFQCLNTELKEPVSEKAFQQLLYWEGMQNSAVSLNWRVDDRDDAGEFGDFVPDETVATPEEASDKIALKETLERFIATLDGRRQRIFRLYHGLEDGMKWTHEDISEDPKVLVTRERVRQLLKDMKKKLITWDRGNGDTLRSYVVSAKKRK